MGAVLVTGGRFYVGGFNKNKTHPKSPNLHCIHAEVDVLVRPRNDRLEYDLYVIRLTKGGSIGTSKPCKDCMFLIRKAEIKSVTYIDENGQIKKENF